MTIQETIEAIKLLISIKQAFGLTAMEENEITDQILKLAKRLQ